MMHDDGHQIQGSDGDAPSSGDTELNLFRLAEEARRARLEDERLFARRAAELGLGRPEHEDHTPSDSIPEDRSLPNEVTDAVIELEAASDRLVTVMADYADVPSVASATAQRAVGAMADSVLAVLDASGSTCPGPPRDNRDVLPDPILRRGRLIEWAERRGLRYTTAVGASLGSALVTAAAIAFGLRVLGLGLLMVYAFFDSLDGGLARRDPKATSRGMYAACLASHLNDLILIAGLTVWTATDHEGLAVALMAATCLSLYASLARTQIIVCGIRISRSWLERFVRVAAVALALAVGTPWVAIVVLAAGAVVELVVLALRMRRQKVEKVLALVLEHPRGTDATVPRQEQASEWRPIVRRENQVTAAPGFESPLIA